MDKACKVEGDDVISRINVALGSEVTLEDVWKEVLKYPKGGELLDDAGDDAEREGLERHTTEFETRANEIAIDKMVDIIRGLPKVFEGLVSFPVVYRAMVIDDIDDFMQKVRKEGKTDVGCIGTSWAWDLEHAIVYMTRCGTEYVLFAAIDVRNIDVLETVVLYVIFSSEENEIKLYGDSKVKIFEIKNKETGISMRVDIDVCV